jgi:hypothetical protein
MPGDWCSFCRWPGRVLSDAAGAVVTCVASAAGWGEFSRMRLARWQLAVTSVGLLGVASGLELVSEALSRVCPPLARVRVTLRLTVGQLVCLGIEPRMFVNCMTVTALSY